MAKNMWDVLTTLSIILPAQQGLPFQAEPAQQKSPGDLHGLLT